MATKPTSHSHHYRVEFPLSRARDYVECVQFPAPDAAIALLKAQAFVPDEITVSMFEDDQCLGTVRLLEGGFWQLSENNRVAGSGKRDCA